MKLRKFGSSLKLIDYQQKSKFDRDKKLLEDKFGTQVIELGAYQQEDDTSPPTKEKSKRYRYLMNTHLKIQRTMSQNDFQDEILSPANSHSRALKT